MIRGDERYWANMVLDVIEHVECPMLMYEGEKMIVRKALKAYLEDRKDEPQTELKGSKRLVKGSDPCAGCIYDSDENVLACVACVLKDKQSGKE